MSQARKRLRDDVRLDVVFEDGTAFGSAISGRADEFIRLACSGIVDHRKRYGPTATVMRSRELLEEAFSRHLVPLYSSREKLREDCLYPPADRIRPVALNVEIDQEVRTIPLSSPIIPELAPWMFEMQRSTSRPASGAGRILFDQLESCGAFTEDPVHVDSPPPGDVSFIGHATIMLTRGARIVIDPFILPRSPGYPTTYQPHRMTDLLPLDAVLITHSHPDHFDLGSLLRLGSQVPIYVPEVERESLLAIDMAARLEQLGFSNVHRIRPGAEFVMGEVRIRTFPFLGEQPTTGDILHPEVRNAGCTYLYEYNGKRILALADSGRDRSGDVRDLAASIGQSFGDVNVLFGGYRTFGMYPILYLFSSVSRFLLFVPANDLTSRQEIMNDGDALIDTAERCGARQVVPYAAGGAPWYWERGLGWAPKGIANARNDPPPEDVVHSASARGRTIEGPVASPVRVLPLRAGEGLRFANGDVQVEHGPLQTWPYDPARWEQANISLTTIDGSMLKSARCVFNALEPALKQWRQQGRLQAFFFMRKQPGLRLRFLGDNTLSGDLAELLDGLIDIGAADSWFRSLYEPEADRFGGLAAMAAVHNWFDADSTQWMILDRLRLDGRAAIGRDTLCAAVALDLVKTTVPDRGESWAVWRHYASGNNLPESAAQDVEVRDFEFLVSLALEREQDTLRAYQEANRVLSARLLSLWGQGELSAGLRGVLAAIILFHFNRHGVNFTDNARIAWSMIRALDPSVP